MLFETVEIFGYPVCWNAIISIASVVATVAFFFVGAIKLERRGYNGKNN